MRGLRLALSWLTVFPVRSATVDATSCRQAITVAPVVGVLLGGIAAAGLGTLGWLGASPLLAGVLVVGLLAVLTRGMHVDGLADTADGLGCYGPPERALAVMRDGGAGPFGVTTLIVVLGAEAASIAALGSGGRWAAVVLACAVGRAAFTLCCLRGVPAARPEGMGVLVASSQPWVVPVVWWLALTAAGLFVGPGRPWLGPLAVLLAAGLVALLIRHVRRRFGGITGDVLGAAGELATATVLTVCALAQ